MKSVPDDLRELIDVYLSREATEKQAEQLSIRLRNDEQARELFLELSDIHGCLTSDESLWTPESKTDVLLHYYAKHIDAQSTEDMNKLARAEQLDLDIVPTFSKDGVELQVLWKGKPASGRPFYLRGAGGLKKNLTTDEQGRVRFAPLASGFHSMRTTVEELDRSD